MENRLKAAIQHLPWAVFAIVAVLNLALGKFNLCYMEQWQTFIYDANIAGERIAEMNGANYLLSLLIIQFFTDPYLAILINAAVLSCIYLLQRDFLMRISQHSVLISNTLPLITVGMVLAMQYNTNLFYTYTTGILMASLLLWISSLINNEWGRLAFLAASTPLLILAAGPVATAYMAIATLSGIRAGNRIYYLALPLVFLISCAAFIHAGYAMNLVQILSLRQYADIRITPSLMSYECLIAMVVSAFLAMMARKWRLDGNAWLCVGIVAVSVGIGFVQRNRNNEIFKELNYLSRHQQYGRIIELCAQNNSNVLFHNYRNMALGEMGLLGDSLFSYPNMGLASIIMQSDKSYFMKAMYSDAQYAMGNIAAAQQYAFESLQMTRNTSPKMLMRLAETNIAFGELDAARKYLHILSKTLAYSHQANEMISMIDSGQIYQYGNLAEKRSCMPAHDSAMGFPNMDKILELSLEANPANSKTMQYLGSLYLLEKNMERFRQVVQKFYGTPCLPKLPRYFEEAMYLIHSGNADSLAKYHIDSQMEPAGNYKKYYLTRLAQ